MFNQKWTNFVFEEGHIFWAETDFSVALVGLLGG
jgi:hypothetical protein